MATIPCAIVRGGTSKGVFILEEHLPADQKQRDRVLLEIMGSPDPRQIDGLGGGDPLTSKVVIVSRSRRDGIDVEYESVEVGITEAHVNHGLMCGNLIAGVGHFAIAEGLIKVRSPLAEIKIYCRSNRKTIIAIVPVSAADPRSPAMPDKNAMVSLVFSNPGGAITGRLLPVGEPVSLISASDHNSIEVSIVDAGTLYAFVRADSLGLSGHESAAMLDGNAGMRATIELLRRKVANLINQHTPNAVSPIVPRLVKVAIIARADPWQGDVDIVARVINTEKVHKAYAVSGGISLAAAAAIHGTLVNQLFCPQGSPFKLRIGHPSGTLSLLTNWSKGADGFVVHSAEIQRSARLILRGMAYIHHDPETPQPANTFSSPQVRSHEEPAAHLEAIGA